MKIFFSGGGTLGPVTPLIAILESLRSKNPDWEFGWVGTKGGPEYQVVNQYHLPFFSIAAGKLRRYFSLKNFWDLGRIISGFFQSFIILLKERPDLLISAGGFVSVPLHYAAFILRIPTWIHQQDVVPGLANRLMAPLASKITVALEVSRSYFSSTKTEWIGNPVRDLQPVSQAVAQSWFGIVPASRTILVLGGGTGSEYINEWVFRFLPELSAHAHIIHLLGTGQTNKKASSFAHITAYHPYQFLHSEMNLAYAAADIVVARAGFATLSELSYAKKAAIIIPMPQSHQEENAAFFANRNGCLLFKQSDDAAHLLALVNRLLASKEMAATLGNTLSGLLPLAAPDVLVGVVNGLTCKKKDKHPLQ